MRKSIDPKIPTIIALVVVIAVSLVMAGCSGGGANNNANQANVNRTAPQTVPTPAPAPDPAQALFGEWETDNADARSLSGGTTAFVRWKINPGVKDQSGIYTGKLTDPDRSNMDLANYKVGPGNIISLEFTSSTPPRSVTYDFEVSSDGNTLTLKATPPIILKRGSSNRDILKDAETIHNSGNRWEPTPNTATILNTKFSLTVDHVLFDKPMPSGEGYGGAMSLVDIVTPSTKPGQYIVSAKGSVILDVGAGRTPGTYVLEQNGDLLKIKLQDGTEWVFNRK